MLPYYQHRHDISLVEGLLLKDTRIIIPRELQGEVKNYIHVGHQGITKCRRLAQTSVWWLGLSKEIEELVKNCPECIEESSNRKETYKCDSLPTRPMEKIGLDLFKWDKWYLIITDYYSRYFEFFPLSCMSEESIIEKVKEFFSRFRICSVCRSDNGPQFQSKFKQFANDYHFKHITSSPYYSQSNGFAEAAVKVAKRMIKKCKNIHESLLNYRATPLANGYSPAELMMGRKFKSLLPVLPSTLESENSKNVLIKEQDIRRKQVQYYNKRHRAKDLSELKNGDRVWVTDLRKYGKVLKKLDEPRSYLIQIDRERYRRNRWHLIPLSDAHDGNFHDSEEFYSPEENFIIDDSAKGQVDQSQILEESPSVENIEIPEAGPSPRRKRAIKPPSWTKDYVLYD